MKYIQGPSAARIPCSLYHAGYRAEQQSLLEEGDIWGQGRGSEDCHWEVAAQPKRTFPRHAWNPRDTRHGKRVAVIVFLSEKRV